MNDRHRPALIFTLILSTTLCLAAATASARPPVAAHDDGGSVAAQVTGRTTARGTDYVPIYHPELEILPATGEIRIDGELDDPGWRGAAVADNFAEHNPGDQTQPEVDTEVLVTYDAKNLYVAWICYDDPNEVRATFCERDAIFGDDYVILALDPFGENAVAYEIAANPYGIQGDLFFSIGNGEDGTYEMIFESDGKLTPYGWVVEMAIPFAEMRFPDKPIQEWRVDFWRNRPRDSRFQYSWAAYDRDESCWPCKWGTVRGARDIEHGSGLEVLPSLVFGQSGARNEDGEWKNAPLHMNPFGEPRNLDLGLGLSYDISSEFSAEATINPDFSQVESDAAQLDINSTFALFYPERRPFFQEGADLFKHLLHGDLHALDQRPDRRGEGDRPPRGHQRRRAQRLGRPLGHHPALRGGQRLRRERRERHERRAGPAGAGRPDPPGRRGHRPPLPGRRLRLDGRSGRQPAPDAERRDRGTGPVLAHPARWTASTCPPTGPIARPSTRAPIPATWTGRASTVTPTTPATNATPNASAWTSTTGSARRPGAPEAGFEPGNAYRGAYVSTNYQFRFEEDTSLLETITPSANVGRKWNFEGTKKDEWLDGSLSWSLRKYQTNFHARGMYSNELYHGIQFDDIWLAHICGSMRPSKTLYWGGNYNYGHRIARHQEVMGKETVWGLWFTLRPGERLIVSNSLDRISSDHVDTGERLFSDTINRTTISYQFSRELSARLILQYRDDAKVWEADPLITYKINPLSTFFLGRHARLPRPGAAGQRSRGLAPDPPPVLRQVAVPVPDLTCPPVKSMPTRPHPDPSGCAPGRRSSTPRAILLFPPRFRIRGPGSFRPARPQIKAGSNRGPVPSWDVVAARQIDANKCFDFRNCGR